MYEVSQEYKRAIRKQTRKFEWQGTITFVRAVLPLKLLLAIVVILCPSISAGIRISVSLPVSAAWLKRLRKMKKEPYVNVEWLDPETGELSSGTMYIDGFKVSLEHDTSGGSLWTVSFSLEDLNDV